MNVALRQPMTVEQFLAWEGRQKLRHEFDGFRPIAMAGGTAAHAGIQVQLLAALSQRLRGGRCRPYGSELKIAVAGSIRYPDAFVVCSPVAGLATVVAEPVVVFEILSESSVNTDLVVKNAEYAATPSVRHYVVIEQTHRGAIVFSRKGGDWTAEIVTGDGALRLPAVGIEIPLSEIYADLDIPPADADDAEAPAPG